MSDKLDTVIIGAGPAGCAAGMTLVNAGRKCIILDKLDKPGGLSRSIRRSGCTFDVGPHRFFTKSNEVLNMWRSTLNNDLITVDRLTRILYKGKLFNYPLSPLNALFGLGVGTSLRAFASYGLRKARLAVRPREPVSFEDWVADNFGLVLYEAFFKHYTEKVWGIPCADISSDWASQRIKGLSLFRAVYNALTAHRGSRIKTLVDRFLYPRSGAGTLYESMIEKIVANGSTYIPGVTVTEVRQESNLWTVNFIGSTGDHNKLVCNHLLSSAPLTELLGMLSPPVPEEIMSAAASLSFRNHYCVNLIVKGKANLFPDNWIYVHSPEQHMGRIANFANFSSELQQSDGVFPVTVEFFSSTGDEVDIMSDKERIKLAIKELREVGFLNSSHHVEDAFVVFSKSAYPVIARGYDSHVDTIKGYLRTLTGLQTMGRAGLFQYNNQDHSVMTGILAARNVLGSEYDVWSVNEDAEYLESGTAPDLCDRDRENGA
jgi:protoporphyrinogen oxidase